MGLIDVRSAGGSPPGRLAVDVGLLVLAETAAKGGTFALTLVAARTLTRSEFGTYSYALALALLLSSAPSWGFYTLLVQRASVRPSDLRRLAVEVMVLQTLIGTPLFVAAALTCLAIMQPAAAAATALILSATLVDVLLDGPRGVCAVRGRQRDVALALIVQRFVTALIAVACLLLAGSLLGLSMAYFIGAIAGALSLIRALDRAEVRLKLGDGVSKKGLRQTLRLSVPIGLQTVSGMVLFRADMVLIGVLLNKSAVSAYAVAYRLLDSLLFLTFVVGRVVLPGMSSSGRADRVRSLLRRGLALCAVAYMPIAAVVLVNSAGLIGFLFGRQYVEADTADSLRLLALAPMAFSVAFLASFALFAFDHWRESMAIAVASAAVNVTANFVLIPTIGIRGAAATTTLSYVLQAGLVWRAVCSLIGRLALLQALAPSALGAAVLGATLVGLSDHSFVALPVGALTYVVTWALVAWLVDREQLNAARSLLRLQR